MPAPYLRILQMDVMRGFAVLGIYLVNITIFALPVSNEALAIALHDSDALNTLIATFTDTYVEGSMRGLFSLLFGASALIFLDEARLQNRGLELVDRYYRRTLLLILFGLLHAFVLLWPYDVLYDYGVLGLFLFPLRKLSARILAMLGIALLVIGDITLLDIDITDKTAFPDDEYATVIPAEPESALSSTDHDLADKPMPPAVDPEAARQQVDNLQEVITYRSGYLTIFNEQRDQVIYQQSDAFYRQHVFDIGGMMLIGMALFKLGVLSGQRARSVYLLMTIGGFLVGAVIRGAFVDIEFLPLHKVSELVLALDGAYNLGRLSITLGYVGLVGLLCSLPQAAFLYRPLAATGRMALTNYILQSVISLFLFYGIGLALFATLQRYQLLLICLGVWLFQVTFSVTWLRYFKQGPLEWIWRSLIYGAAQPNRR